MLDKIFGGVLGASAQAVSLSLGLYLLCIGAAVLCGLLLTVSYNLGGGGSRSFVVTLAMLPAVVALIIMSVNGSIGAGVAVAGAFSLVRFRSAPGNARDIGSIFISVAAGILCGMGYIGYALLSTVILGVLHFIYDITGLGADTHRSCKKVLRITVPEDLEFGDMFDDIFEKFTKTCECTGVKTTNMGSLYRLTYAVTLKNPGVEKAMIDEIRCRNGNLEINLSSAEEGSYEL